LTRTVSPRWRDGLEVAHECVLLLLIKQDKPAEMTVSRRLTADAEHREPSWLTGWSVLTVAVGATPTTPAESL
jgi:hypothetical protein